MTDDADADRGMADDGGRGAGNSNGSGRTGEAGDPWAADRRRDSWGADQGDGWESGSDTDADDDFETAFDDGLDDTVNHEGGGRSSRELDVRRRQTELMQAIDAKGIGDVLKPLTREIFLFDTYIAGTTHLKDESVLDDVKEGDKLILRREDNPYDENAILVLDSRKRKLGYIPARYNIVFSRLMDAGKMLTAKVTGVEERDWYTRISIDIFLVDF